MHPDGRLILAGHSSGGGFVFRIAVGPDAHLFDRFVLLSPIMPYGAVTYRPDVGGWVTPYIGRIVALKILNRFGSAMVQWPDLDRLSPSTGTPRCRWDASYTYRMQTNLSPPDARRDLDARCAYVCGGGANRWPS